MATVIDATSTLGDLVSAHPELAREFERRSLDYCCGGARTLSDACHAASLDSDQVVQELTALTTQTPAPWAEFDAAALADYIEGTHHAYLHDELPRISALAAKVAGVHGANHPELVDVERTVAELQADLDPHLAKEELVLFPLIRQLAKADHLPESYCGSVANPVSMMMREHDQTADILGRLRSLAGGYAVPSDGCASYASLYAALEQLESDTHLHIHLENNRLFPMAVELESHLGSTPAVEPQSGPR